jgi:hypothetical protein
MVLSLLQILLSIKNEKVNLILLKEILGKNRICFIWKRN